MTTVSPDPETTAVIMDWIQTDGHRGLTPFGSRDLPRISEVATGMEAPTMKRFFAHMSQIPLAFVPIQSNGRDVLMGA